MNEGGLICGIGDEDLIIEDLTVTHKKKFRALSTIIYGCNNFCSYCIVPYVRGRERSRAPEDVLKELKMLGDQGFIEVMLLGQNVNSYGKDFDSYDFADLLSDASKIDAISRIRFMTSHPKDTDRKLLDVMANGGNIMPHLHLPVQSGSDRVLALMNRKYSAGQYLDIVEYARKVIPDISITTDIIVGFPGEKEEDFSETLSLMERIRFDNAFTFMFSPRKGTPAADMDDQIPDDVMRERFSRLVKLQNKCTLESGMKTLNTVQTVLVEGLSQNSDKVYAGRTPHNRIVNFTCDKAIEEGDIVDVDITSVKTFSLNGRFLSFNSGNGG
jgi:tRNA-2-methylthio-N6-dimethylallyladenosine synthase